MDQNYLDEIARQILEGAYNDAKLKLMLNDAIKEENYELAQKIKEKLDSAPEKDKDKPIFESNGIDDLKFLPSDTNYKPSAYYIINTDKLSDHREKLKFFALYFFQNVGKCDNFLSPNSFSLISPTSINYIDYIELKAFSSITEEEAYTLISMRHTPESGVKFKNIHVGDKVIRYETGSLINGVLYIYMDHLSEKQADYLRSKGYAIPWLKYSLDDLLDKKWLKLQ